MNKANMTIEQLHEFVRSQEKDNMRSQYQASFDQSKPQQRKTRPSTANHISDKTKQTAQRFRNQYVNVGQTMSPSQAYAQNQSETKSQMSHGGRSMRSQAQYSVHEQGCPKHRPAPSTVSHTSSKAAAMMSPQPTNRQNLREMNTKKFLQTDIKTYLEKDEHVTCISCQNCVKIKDKVLQYKYQRGIQSSYGATFANTKGHQKQAVFNLDNERRQLKVPYNPPRRFETTNGQALVDTKGSNMIGAMSKSGRGYERKGAPKGETEDNMPRTFNNNSSYQLTFPVYGKLPEPNKRPSKPFAPGYGKVDATSSYQNTFSGAPDQKYRETAKLEKQRVKAYQKQQVRGTLNPSVPLPFKGVSTAQKEFVNRKNQAVEKVLPFNMLVVPHGMSMHTKSEAQSKFDAKPTQKPMH